MLPTSGTIPKKNYSDWLAENISFPSEICQYLPSTSTDQPSSKPGRPSKSFEECCEKTKWRRLREFVKSTSQEEISTAA